MTSYDSELEHAVLESVVPKLEAEGFRVFLQPSRSVLPPFMHAYRPDAIALKGDRKIAIEIMSKSPNADAKLQRLQDLFSAHPEWELRILYASPRRSEPFIKIPSKEVVRTTLSELPEVIEEAGPIPALLTAWSTFEAAARLLIPERLQRPQAPERLLEVLASEGYVTPREADGIRKLGHLRNRAAHGDLDIAFTPAQLGDFIRLVQALLDLSPNTSLEARPEA